MPIEELYLLLGENVCGVPGVGFQAHQALVTGFRILAQPDTAHTGGADVDLPQPQFLGDALGAVGGVLQT